MGKDNKLANVVIARDLEVDNYRVILQNGYEYDHLISKSAEYIEIIHNIKVLLDKRGVNSYGLFKG